MRSLRLHIPIILATLLITSVAHAQSGRATSIQKRQPVQQTNQSPKTNRTSKQDSDEDEIIRVASNLVSIPVFVTDERQRPVGELTKSDFILEVDDEEKRIDEFITSDSPVSLALVLDNSFSISSVRDFEKQAAIRFLQTSLKPNRDRAMLISVSTEWKIEHPMTENLNALTSAIIRLPKPVGATALLDAVEAAMQSLSQEQGRKIVVVISDGEDTISDISLNDLLSKLYSTGVQVFVVKTTEYENFKRTGNRVLSENVRQLVAEKRMNEITRQTGGFVSSPVNDDDLNSAFAQIALELEKQYLLTYSPEADGKTDSVFRKIKVSVRNRSDVKVRARAGYIGPN